MSKFYIANGNLDNLLTKDLGMTFHDRQVDEVVPEDRYYTYHKNGKQIKYSEESGEITFMDKLGNFVDMSTSFTDKQIIKFIEN